MQRLQERWVGDYIKDEEKVGKLKNEGKVIEIRKGSNCLNIKVSRMRS